MALLPAVAGWMIGMLFAFHPMILSRFAVIQGDWADARFNNYILEHSYRWLVQAPGHERFWSPPMFFPAPNTAAYSDVLLGVAPFYWLWRAIGIAPDTSFQLWMLAVATANYVAALALFARGFRCRPLAAATGAALFCFASIRIEQLIHPQLVSQFYLAIAVLALVRLFESAHAPGPTGDARVRGDTWILVLALACVGQLYASYYNAWFLFFAMALAALWCVLAGQSRMRLVTLLRTHWRALSAAGALSALLLAPLAIHYLRASSQVGMRSFFTVQAMLPRAQSWAYMGPGSWLYGALAERPLFHLLPMEHEQRLGAGVATTLVALVGLWGARRRRVIQVVTLVPVVMALLATEWPGGFSAWHAVYALVPGAAAMRAVSRIGIAIALPLSLGVALAVDRIVGSVTPASRWTRNRLARALVIALVLAVIALEQGQRLPSFDKLAARERTARVAREVDPKCSAFLSTIIGGAEDPWR
ncbi:MAG: hypothetical protein ACHQRL_10350, partial [Gemmatimonadales bacterium]